MIIGWQEYVDLPKLKLRKVQAKIDTGARTSALHATKISRFDKDGEDWVRFQARFDPSRKEHWVEHPIHDTREIKNTGGVPEMRYIIRTAFVIQGRRWKIDLSLTDRNNMKFRMIVGRTALKNHAIAVDTRRTHMIDKKD